MSPLEEAAARLNVTRVEAAIAAIEENVHLVPEVDSGLLLSLMHVILIRAANIVEDIAGVPRPEINPDEEDTEPIDVPQG